MPAILHILHDFSDNSTTRIASLIMRALSKRGFRFHAGAVTDKDEASQYLRAAGVRTVEFFRQKNIVAAIQHYVRSQDIRIVHSHSPRTAIQGYFALHGQSSIAHIQTRHLLATPTSRRWGLLYTAADRLSLYLSQTIIPVSKTMEEQIQRIPGISPSRVISIQNGVDTDMFFQPQARMELRKDLGIEPHHKVLIFNGRLELMKRLDILLEAFGRIHAEFPEAILVIAGEGSLENELRSFAQSLQIHENVRWLGFRRDIPSLLAAADIYVQSSSNEGLSLSILEAMAAEKTVISTDVGAAREVLDHMQTGIIIPPNNPARLAEAFRIALSDPERAQALASRARMVAKERFSVERMVDAYADVYLKSIRA
jgi:glycosyltransferase involved in cell wall biosynthesis